MTESAHTPVGPKVLASLPGTDWGEFAARILADAFAKLGAEGIDRIVMLAGGRSAEQVYRYWGRHIEQFPGTPSLRLLFGDERCVAPDHAESNFGMAERCWIGAARRAGRIGSVARMEAEREDRGAAARAYELSIPQVVDILLLGMGEDGHIASLFPHDAAVHERNRRVVAVSGPKPPRDRLTVTPVVLDAAEAVFILATGVEKGRVLARAFDDLDDIDALPVRLVLPRAILLLDAEAAQELSGIAGSRN